LFQGLLSLRHFFTKIFLLFYQNGMEDPKTEKISYTCLFLLSLENGFLVGQGVKCEGSGNAGY